MLINRLTILKVIMLFSYFNHSMQTGNLTSNDSTALYNYENTEQERQTLGLLIVFGIYIIFLLCGVLHYAFCFFCKKLSAHWNASLETEGTYSLASSSDQMQDAPPVCGSPLFYQIEPSDSSNGNLSQVYNMPDCHNDHQHEINSSNHQIPLEHVLAPAILRLNSSLPHLSV